MWAGEADNLETRAGNKKVEAKSKAPHAKPAYGPKVTATGSALGGKTPEGLAVRTVSITSGYRVIREKFREVASRHSIARPSRRVELGSSLQRAEIFIRLTHALNKHPVFMKITFLGTAAATSYPLAFCRCKFCNTARERGGKDFRKRSSVIVNDDLLIDMGPDIMSASFLYGKSIADIRYHLQTHSHSDHFDSQVFTTRSPEYRGVNTPRLQVYASTKTLARMAEMVKNDGYVNNFLEATEQARMNLEVFPVKPFDSFKIGSYDATAFPTDHDTAVESLLWAITENDFTLFYGTDTDIIPEETWKGFHEKNLKFNVVVLDHTYGPDADSGGHLNANRFVQQIQRMKVEELLADHARILATHISHEGNPPHAELSEYAAKFGYEIAYDGLVI